MVSGTIQQLLPSLGRKGATRGGDKKGKERESEGIYKLMLGGSCKVN